MDNQVFDSIIIGAGLAGLIAGIYLQKNGYKVLILEKRSQAGGLCGTHFFDGHEFAIGCNDFGSRMQKDFESLEIPVRFLKSKNRFFLQDNFLEIPLNGR